MAYSRGTTPGRGASASPFRPSSVALAGSSAAAAARAAGSPGSVGGGPATPAAAASSFRRATGAGGISSSSNSFAAARHGAGGGAAASAAKRSSLGTSALSSPVAAFGSQSQSQANPFAAASSSTRGRNGSVSAATPRASEAGAWTLGSAGKGSIGTGMLSSRSNRLLASGSGLLPPSHAAGALATHETLVKATLSVRLKRLYILSLLLFHFLFTYLQSILSHRHPFAPLTSLSVYTFGYDKHGRDGPGLLGPVSLLATLSAWALGVLPLLVAAKWSLGASRPPSPKPSLARGAPLYYALEVLQNPRTWAAALLHALAATAVAFFFWLCALSFAHQRTNPWSLRMVVPHRQGQHRPNEHVVYLFASSAVFGAAYSVARLLIRPVTASATHKTDTESWVTSPPTFEADSIDLSIGARVKNSLPSALVRALPLSASISLAQLVCYFFSRRMIYRNILSVIGTRSPLRSVLIPSFRHSFFTLGFVSTMLLLNAFFAVVWATAEVLWQVYATQPLVLSSSAKDPTRCLVQGLLLNHPSKGIATGSSSQYYRHFAFAELCMIARGDSARRRAIYKDLSNIGARQLAPRPLLPGDATPAARPSFGTTSITSSPVATPRRPAALSGTSSGNAWNVILGQCLEVLEQEKRWARSFGQIVQPHSSKPAHAQNQPAAASFAPGSRSILKEDPTSKIVNVPKASLLDKLADPSTAKGVAAPDKPAATSSSASTPASIWHKLAPSSTVEKASAAANKAAAATRGTAPASTGLAESLAQGFASVCAVIPEQQQQRILALPLLKSLSAAWAWLTSPSPSLIVTKEVLQGHNALLQWATVILSNLATASLQEDDFGIVQKDLPAVVLSCAELLSALDAWAERLQSAAQQARKDRERFFIAQRDNAQLSAAWDVTVGPLAAILRDAVNNVLVTFEGYDLDLRADEKELIKRVVTPSAGTDAEEDTVEMSEATR